MITNIYTIFDSKAGFYNKPFYMVNDAVAMRSMGDMLQDPNTELARNPEDFTLFKLGTYDDQSASLDCFTEFEVVARLHELKQTMITELSEQLET